LKTRGSVLVDQIRAVERSERMFGIIESAPSEVVVQVRLRLAALLGFNDNSAIAWCDDGQV
jgi:mRNA interferase MazF